MEEYEIDDLLKQVSPELLAGYEKKNLTEGTLMGVNEKYKLAIKKNRNLSSSWSKRVLCIALLALTGTIVSIVSPYDSLQSYVGVGLVIGGILSSIFLLLGPIEKNMGEFQDVRDRYEPILTNFRQSVEGLNPTWCGFYDKYDETSVRETLVGFTVRLLDAEIKFKRERMFEDAATFSVVHYGNWEVKCRDELENMLRAVEKFGLAFDKGDLFKDAKKHLERVS